MTYLTPHPLSHHTNSLALNDDHILSTPGSPLDHTLLPPHPTLPFIIRSAELHSNIQPILITMNSDIPLNIANHLDEYCLNPIRKSIQLHPTHPPLPTHNE